MSILEKRVFGGALKNALSELGWTQQIFAEKVGVNESDVSRWIRGEVFPRLSNRKKIAKVLGKTLEDLGLDSKEIQLEDTIIKQIRKVFQSGDLTKIHAIANCLETLSGSPSDLAADKNSFISRIQPSSTEHEDVIVWTVEGEKRYLPSWVGPQDCYIEDVVAIATGNHIASWRYLKKDGQPHREPSDTDMHLHIRNGYTVSYDPPILLLRLFMLSPSTGARCIP